jgi:hypothetical protein
MNAPVRLTPTMTSRKLLALGFVRRYISEHGGSPTYGEIGEGVGVSRERARDLVRSLVRDGKLERESGAKRGIRLPMPDGVADIDGAIALLRARGFKVDEEGLGLAAAVPFTSAPLPMLPELEHIPDIEIGIGNGAHDEASKNGQRERGVAGDRRARTPAGTRRAA